LNGGDLRKLGTYPTIMSFIDTLVISLPSAHALQELSTSSVSLFVQAATVSFFMGLTGSVLFGLLCILLRFEPDPEPKKLTNTQVKFKVHTPVICRYGTRVHYHHPENKPSAVAIVLESGVYQVRYKGNPDESYDTSRKWFPSLEAWEATLPVEGYFTTKNTGSYSWESDTIHYGKRMLRAWSSYMLDPEIKEILSNSEPLTKEQITNSFEGELEKSTLSFALSSLQKRGDIWALKGQKTVYTLPPQTTAYNYD